MRFVLDALLEFSKDLKGAESDIESILKDAENDLFKRGVPEGRSGAKVKESKISGSKLKLCIEGTTYIRPHNALFRLKKPFSEKLGKEHKIGLRKVKAEKYEIEFSLEKNPKKKFEIPFADLKFTEKKCSIALKNLEDDFLQKNYIDRMISLIKDKIEAQHYEGKSEHWEILYQSDEKKHFWKEDPTKEMVKRRWIKHTTAPGQWVYGPEVTKMFKTMEEIVVDELIKPLGFDEMIFPKMVTWDVWKKSGHAKSIYPEIYYVCPPKTRDKKFWEEIMDEYKITGEVPLEKVKEKIDVPIGAVTYAQCPPFWTFVSGTTLSDDCLPITVFDRSGTSMRYEAGGIHGIERVNEFHRIEILWLGYPDQVEEVHEKLIETYKHIFNDILELEWRMAWVTPWFMAQEGLKGLAEKGEERRIGTVDFEAYLPYRGSRKDSEWLEFQNASNNGPKYPNGFNVKGQKEELYSGCTGIGLERWVASFTAQYGLDIDNWPKEVKKRYGKLPKNITFM